MTITVVGIGADGWAGLTDPARAALRAAPAVLGSGRQLGLLPAEVTAARVAWPAPLLPALPGLLDAHPGAAVLASGDPMWHGIGGTLARLVGADRLRVLPHPSSISLACARLGWPVEDTTVVTLVGRPPATLHAALHPGRRLLVLAVGAACVARILTGQGYGHSVLTALTNLGGPGEDAVTGPAHSWEHPDDPLTVAAVVCVPDPGTVPLPLVPGLPDDAYQHDGQLTKRDVRAVTLARLGPLPGQLLWDVGAGAGSIGIEWLRSTATTRAIAVERDPARAQRITANADRLGVPQLDVVTGAAPDALAGLAPPDAVFVGGGATVPGVLDACWAALRPGGRLVVSAVTIESETAVADRYARHGGELTRVAVSRVAPVGGFTAWRPALPVTLWTVTR